MVCISKLTADDYRQKGPDSAPFQSGTIFRTISKYFTTFLIQTHQKVPELYNYPNYYTASNLEQKINNQKP